MTWNRQPTMDSDVKTLQDNLGSLRKIAGWDQETLAAKLGVPKSTIAGFERDKPIPMARVYFIAIMALLDKEVLTNQSNKLLAQAMVILFGQNEAEGDGENNGLAQAAISVIGASVAAGGDRNEKSNEIYNKMLKDASVSSNKDPVESLSPLEWLHDTEIKDANEDRRERIMLMFDSVDKIKEILKTLPAEGVDIAGVVKSLEPELLSKADSLICKSLFEDIWDNKWQKKRITAGANQALAELKIILENIQPEIDKQLHLIGLLFGEKFLSYSRLEGKEYIKGKLLRAYRKFEELYEIDEKA